MNDKRLNKNVPRFPKTLSLIFIGVICAVYQIQNRLTHHGKRNPAVLSSRLEVPHFPGLIFAAPVTKISITISAILFYMMTVTCILHP